MPVASRETADQVDTLLARKFFDLVEKALFDFPELLWTWTEGEAYCLWTYAEELGGIDPLRYNSSGEARAYIREIDKLTRKFDKWDSLPAELKTVQGLFELFWMIDHKKRRLAKLAKEFILMNPSKVVEAWMTCEGVRERFNIGNLALNDKVFLEARRRINKIRREGTKSFENPLLLDLWEAIDRCLMMKNSF